MNNVCSHECNPIFQYVRDGRIILPLPFLSFSMNRDVKLCVALVLFMGACNAMHSQRRQQRQRFMQQFFVHSHKRDISNCFFVMLLPSTFAYHCQLSLSCLFESCVQSANAIWMPFSKEEKWGASERASESKKNATVQWI